MVEKKKPIFLKVALLVILFLLLEGAAFVYFYLPSGFVGISGLAIRDFSDIYTQFYPSSKIFLIVQWAIIAILLILVYIKNMGIHKRNSEVSGIDVKSAMGSSKTPLDVLYSLLEKKKQLSLKTIAELFKIDQDLAIEWARILEAGDLVVIDYPGMGSPLVKIKEEEVEEETKGGKEGKETPRGNEKKVVGIKTKKSKVVKKSAKKSKIMKKKVKSVKKPIKKVKKVKKVKKRKKTKKKK